MDNSNSAASTLNEVWKDIHNYEGLYQVSSLGRVKNIVRNTILTPNKLNKGYIHITIHKNGLPKTFKAHRLVATAFCINIYNKKEVNHINGIKDDNRVENLEWCTRTENNRHAINTGLLIQKKGELSPKWGKTRGLSSNKKMVLNTENGIYYDCAKDAAESIGKSYSYIKNRLGNRKFNNTSLIYC